MITGEIKKDTRSVRAKKDVTSPVWTVNRIMRLTYESVYVSPVFLRFYEQFEKDQCKSLA